jgi:hypothetical protein
LDFHAAFFLYQVNETKVNKQPVKVAIDARKAIGPNAALIDGQIIIDEYTL